MVTDSAINIREKLNLVTLLHEQFWSFKFRGFFWKTTFIHKIL